MNTDIKDVLLQGWEEVYKKSQLTLWILLSLKDGEKSMASIKEFIAKKTINGIDVDDKSMYRALRRFNTADLIKSRTMPNINGPDIKIWKLTETGLWVLEQFIERQIRGIFFNPENKTLFC